MINKNQQEIKDFLEILNYYKINKKQREFRNSLKGDD